MTVELLVGADPEFFLKDKKGNPVSAHDLVPGTKREPYKLPNGGAVQADGTAVEFNIEPARTAKEFSDNIKSTLLQVRKLVPKEYEFNFQPAVFYPEGYFDKIPDSAKELGCDPDFNGNTGGMNPAPTPTGRFKTMRTAAGHIHLGWTKGKDREDLSHNFDCKILARCLDKVFRPCMPLWDNDTDRIQLYGRTPAYRPKSYGVEYRALSVAWLNYPTLYPWIFDTATSVFNKLSGNGHLYVFDDLEYYLSGRRLGMSCIKQINMSLATANLPQVPENFK